MSVAAQGSLKSAMKKGGGNSKKKKKVTLANSDATAKSAISSSTSTAAIRAAAEQKATQLHATRIAREQWSQWITQVQSKLLQPRVDNSTLRRAALVLRPSEYDEVIEERVVSNLCGWPACHHSLNTDDDDVSKLRRRKKFSVSMAQQRVYDVSEGANYCDADCFVQSHMYKQGLSDEPFYLRQMANQQESKTNGTNKHAIDEEKQHAEASQATASSVNDVTHASDPIAELGKLSIVEKDAASAQSPTPAPSNEQTNADKQAAVAAAMAIEGYQTKSTLPNPSVLSTSASLSSTLRQETMVTNYAAPASSTAASHASSNATDDEKPSSATTSADSVSARSVSLATSASDSSATTTSAPASASPSHPMSGQAAQATLSAPEFLPIAPLPPVLEQSNPHTPPLTRAEFERLTPHEQLDYMGAIALQESKKIERKNTEGVSGKPNQIQHSTHTDRTPLPSHTTSSNQTESKIRRRKSAQSGQMSANTTISQQSATPANDAHASQPSAPSANKRTSPAAAAASSSSASPRTSVLADDLSDPIIKPSDIQHNVAMVRNAGLPPFAALLQCFMRWTTPNIATFIRGDRSQINRSTNAATHPPTSNRARQQAFLQMIHQQWMPIAAALHLQHARPLVRELQELTDCFCFDQPIPPLKAEQWRTITLILMCAVYQRLAMDDDRTKHSMSHGENKDKGVGQIWTFMQMNSSLPMQLPESQSPMPAFSTALHQLFHTLGFSAEQLESLYSQFMIQA